MDRRTYRGNMGSSSSQRRSDSASRDASLSRSDSASRDASQSRSRDDMCDKHMHEDMCERDRHDGDFDRFPLAMSYVPWQCFRDLYENEFVALANGTLFKELDLKWYGRGCK